jgi:putative phosphoesterase
MKRSAIRVGLISDTHGLLRPEALTALRGSDFIVHAGDIGDPSILARLSDLAPLTAVRGNNDHGPWAARLPDTDRLRAGGVRILVLHDLASLASDAVAGDIDVVVSGHSHRPKTERRAGVLYVNPGSAGPRRFRLPITVGMLVIDGSRVESELLSLDVARKHAAATDPLVLEHR